MRGTDTHTHTHTKRDANERKRERCKYLLLEKRTKPRLVKRQWISGVAFDIWAEIIFHSIFAQINWRPSLMEPTTKTTNTMMTTLTTNTSRTTSLISGDDNDCVDINTNYDDNDDNDDNDSTQMMAKTWNSTTQLSYCQKRVTWLQVANKNAKTTTYSSFIRKFSITWSPSLR